MINITNREESKKIDEFLISKYEIPETVLIENSANSILNNIYIEKYNNYIVVCGPGNNGADGLALARLLNMKNKNVKIICPYNNNINYNICKNLNLEFINEVEHTDVIIDAIFGTGLTKKIENPYKKIINDINSNKNYQKLISIDLITEGLENVDEVLMLSTYKEEILYKDVKQKVLDIGINREYYKNSSNKFLVDEEYINKIIKKINIFHHKGNFGKNVIVAKKGAALLATRASIKSGAGYTILLSDADTINKNIIINNEALNEKIKYKINNDTIAIGPNIGVDNKNISFITENIDKNLILDADMLTVLANNKEYIKKLNNNTIITPHYVEFCRLTGENIDSLINNPFESLKRFKNDFKGIVVLKSKNNIIYDGKNFYIVNLGNSKMARAGMGDTLLGIISSYKAQGYNSLEACILGVYVQAKIGSKLSIDNNVVTPSMLIDNL